MINLQDITFTIPIRIDTQERVRNLKTTILYLNKHFETNILVYEESPTPEIPNLLKDIDAKYVYKHIPTTSPLMHRTKLLNMMAKDSTTKFIANYDADVLLKLDQYENSVQTLRENKVDMIFPYNGKFVNIHSNTLNNVLNTLSVEELKEDSGDIFNANSVGGAIFWNKQKFFQIGGENEKFVSWGFEDNSRIDVAQKLGLRVKRCDGCLFHMNHPVSQNSSNTKHQSYMDNQNEFIRINRMSPNELLRDIANRNGNV